MADLKRSTGTGLAAQPPVAGMQNLNLREQPVVHEPEQIIEHAPLVEKELLREPVVEVQRQHHIQPVIHEVEHRIQPIIRTQATAERPIIEQDTKVLEQPIIEPVNVPAGLEAVERATPEGFIHRPKVEHEVVVEHPVEIRHERHIQPIIHEREHHIQPIIKTEVTAEERRLEEQLFVQLPPIIEPTEMLPAAGAPLAAGAVPAATATTVLPGGRGANVAPAVGTGLGAAAAEREVMGPGAGTSGRRVGLGQKIKGAVKEVTGTITRNPAKKEEGKMLMHGIDPATAASTSANRSL